MKVIMQIGKIKVKKKLDWVRLAFILIELGDSELEILTFTFNEMFRNTKTNREISGIIVSYQKKGFDFPTKKEPNKKYSFNGMFPGVHPKTFNRWKRNIEPLKGFTSS